jgi:uncharacterized protein (TIRG00374 family)
MTTSHLDEVILARKILIQGFKIVFSGLLIVLILHRIGIARVVEHIHSSDLIWVCGALILFGASHLMGSYQWLILLRSEGITVSWRKTVSFYFVGLFFNNFLIGNLGGDVFRMVDVRRLSKNGTGAVSTVFFDRFAGLFVLSGMAVVAAPWMITQGDIRFHLRLPILGLIIGWGFVLFLLFNRKFARPFAWLIRLMIPHHIMLKAREVYEKIFILGRDKALLLRVLCLSIVVQSARIMTHYFLGRSLGVTLSPLYYFLIIPIVAVMASLPLSVGGIGLREQTGVVLFGAVGIAALQAFSLEFMAYLVAIVSSLPGGIVFMLRRRVDFETSPVRAH